MKTTFPSAKLAAWLALPFATLVTLLASPLDHWHGRNPPPAAVVPSGYLSSVTAGNGLFIAAGSGGLVFKSSDAVTWVEIESGLDDQFTGLGYYNGLFVGLAASKIFTSPDGEIWTERALTTAQVLTEVASGNGQCVAVGYRADGSGVILSSPDGVEWTPRPVGTVGALNAVAFGDGLFVAVGSANTLVTSPDGLTWTARDTGAQALYPEGLPTLLDVAHADGRWVVVGWGPIRLTGAVALWATSSDGLAWTPQRFEYNHPSFMGRVFWDGTSFVAHGLDGDYGPFYTLWKSAQGAGWQLFGSTPGGTLDLIAAEGVFIAVGDQGAYDDPRCLILTSPDLVNWATYQAQVTDLRWRRLNDVAAADGVLVAGGGNSLFSKPAVALRSTNGREWSGQELGSARGISRLIYANGRFVGVGGGGSGGNGYVLTSTDGANWTFRDGFTSEWLRGITFGNGLFVAVGSGGCVLTSPSGTLWQTRLPQTARDLFGVAFGNGRFVAVGAQGAVLLSDNGVDWGYAGLDSSLSFTAVAFGQATFVAVGTGGLIRTSPEGEQWTPRASGTTEDLLGVAHIVVGFLAVGRRGTLLVSPDGGVWTPVASGTTADLYGATAALGSCFVVGDDGTILQSDPFVDTAPSIVRGPTSRHCLPGATVQMSVEAVGTSPLRYQWFKGDAAIPGATNRTLAIFNVQQAHVGSYTVTVSNPVGTSPVSAPAILSLPDTLRLQARWLEGLRLDLFGETGRDYRIEFREEMNPEASWQPLTTVTLDQVPKEILDPAAAAASRRFYRAVRLP